MPDRNLRAGKVSELPRMAGLFARGSMRSVVPQTRGAIRPRVVQRRLGSARARRTPRAGLRSTGSASSVDQRPALISVRAREAFGIGVDVALSVAQKPNQGEPGGDGEVDGKARWRADRGEHANAGA